MSCYFCDGSRIESIHDFPRHGFPNTTIGTMTLVRHYDGEPMVKVELNTDGDARHLSRWVVPWLRGCQRDCYRFHRGRQLLPILRTQTEGERMTTMKPCPKCHSTEHLYIEVNDDRLNGSLVGQSRLHGVPHRGDARVCDNRAVGRGTLAVQLAADPRGHQRVERAMRRLGRDVRP